MSKAIWRVVIREPRSGGPKYDRQPREAPASLAYDLSLTRHQDQQTGLEIRPYIWNIGHMDKEDAIAALAALAQRTRLDAFRLLVRQEPDGVPVGELARELKTPHNTMSAHLAVLSRASLVKHERRSRSIIYRADLARLREMMLFLMKDCCGGNADLCGSLIAELTAPCCPVEGLRA